MSTWRCDAGTVVLTLGGVDHVLTPEEAVRLLHGAPKVAGPWIMTEPCDCGCDQQAPTNVYHRRVLASGGSWMLASVRPNKDRDPGWRATTWGPEWVHGCGVHGTMEAAMVAADEQLTRDGWVLA